MIPAPYDEASSPKEPTHMPAWNFKRGSSASKSKQAASPQKGESPGKTAITQEMIARRAFEIWERNGRPEGQSEQNWHEAEAQLRGKK